ncbi:MAG: DUF4046 domain-containing protein [Fusobacteriaceae bacterium]
MTVISKMNNRELLNLHPVILYREILNKSIRYFPDGFWIPSDPNFDFRVREILDYLVNVYLRISEEEFVNIVSTKFFIKYNLGGLVDRFNGRTMEILNIAYPGKYRATNLKCYRAKMPKIKSDMLWLIDLFKDIPRFNLNKIETQDFYDNNLGYIFDSLYYPKKMKTYDIFKDICPEEMHKYTKKGGLK